MNIAVILVNYNQCDVTVNCIKSILSSNHSQTSIDILVVDNSDSSEYLLDIKKQLEKEYINENDSLDYIRVINKGYFSGINSGLEQLDLQKFQYVVVGNNDLEYDYNFFKCLLGTEIDKDSYVLAPNIINLDGSHENPRAIKRISNTKKIMYAIYYKSYILAILIMKIRSLLLPIKPNNRAQIQQHIYLSMGACYILTRNFLDKSSFLDNKVFLYGEEVILAEQLKNLGGKLLYVPNLIVKHCEHTSTKKISNKQFYKIQQKSYEVFKRFL